MKICKGYTLLELLVVVAMISIVSAVAISMGNSVQTFLLDKAASQVKYALQFAREHARITKGRVVVHFDNAASSIRVNRIDFSSGSAVESPLMHPLTKKNYIVELHSSSLTGKSNQLQAEFTFSDGSKAPSVTFNQDGTPGRAITSSLFVPIKEPGVWRGFWRIAEGYSTGDWVEHEKILYDCVSSHFAGSSFAADLGSGRWKVRTQPGQVRISAGSYQQVIHVEPSWGFTRVESK